MTLLSSAMSTQPLPPIPYSPQYSPPLLPQSSAFQPITFTPLIVQAPLAQHNAFYNIQPPAIMSYSPIIIPTNIQTASQTYAYAYSGLQPTVEDDRFMPRPEADKAAARTRRRKRRAKSGATDSASDEEVSVRAADVEAGDDDKDDGGPYRCTLCNRVFTRNSNLTRHKRIHDIDKRYECASCNKSFTEKHHLIAHERTHSGEKPYACTVCPRRFNDKSNCGRHIRIHGLQNGKQTSNDGAKRSTSTPATPSSGATSTSSPSDQSDSDRAKTSARKRHKKHKSKRNSAAPPPPPDLPTTNVSGEAETDDQFRQFELIPQPNANANEPVPGLVEPAQQSISLESTDGRHESDDTERLGKRISTVDEIDPRRHSLTDPRDLILKEERYAFSLSPMMTPLSPSTHHLHHQHQPEALQQHLSPEESISTRRVRKKEFSVDRRSSTSGDDKAALLFDVANTAYDELKLQYEYDSASHRTIMSPPFPMPISLVKKRRNTADEDHSKRFGPSSVGERSAVSVTGTLSSELTLPALEVLCMQLPHSPPPRNDLELVSSADDHNIAVFVAPFKSSAQPILASPKPHRAHALARSAPASPTSLLALSPMPIPANANTFRRQSNAFSASMPNLEEPSLDRYRMAQSPPLQMIPAEPVIVAPPCPVHDRHHRRHRLHRTSRHHAIQPTINETSAPDEYSSSTARRSCPRHGPREYETSLHRYRRHADVYHESVEDDIRRTRTSQLQPLLRSVSSSPDPSVHSSNTSLYSPSASTQHSASPDARQVRRDQQRHHRYQHDIAQTTPH